MKVVLGCDHGGVELKNRLKAYLSTKGCALEDVGVNDGESVDYPDVAQKACAAFLEGGLDFGILVCGTGIGISMAANKIDGIRCALLSDPFTAQMAREHNDANFIAFGGRVSYATEPEVILQAFLDASFSGGRHARRVSKIMALQNG